MCSLPLCLPVLLHPNLQLHVCCESWVAAATTLSVLAPDRCMQIWNGCNQLGCMKSLQMVSLEAITICCGGISCSRSLVALVVLDVVAALLLCLQVQSIAPPHPHETALCSRTWPSYHAPEGIQLDAVYS